MSESISSIMEKAFDKILPIPKTPRVYHPPPPARPLSWIPHGQLGNGVYELRLGDFANEIKHIDAQKTSTIPYSSRGWCYLLEGLGKIQKGDFNSAQKAVNDCRKIGLLPIDFVAEDQDETRHFKGIIEASSPTETLTKIKKEVSDLLETIPTYATDFWKGEHYYVMMCVEKGDLLRLFKPICDEYHIPIVSSKGWAPILLRSHIARLAQRAEANGLIPVLLLFYDHDPAGLKISSTFRKNLEDVERGTNWNPESLEIERFGLNSEDIEQYNLTWIEGLQTSSGRESHDYEYIEKFGRKKCEANALFRSDETLKAAQEICRNAIEKYYGKDARERFKKKEDETRKKLSQIYDNEIWTDFDNAIVELIDSFSEKQEAKQQPTTAATKETIVFIDDHFYGLCPKCHTQFNYEKSDADKLVRCRFCSLPMRLKFKDKEVSE